MQVFYHVNYADVIEIALYFLDEVTTSVQVHLYRMIMHLKCLLNGFVVTQEVVRLLSNLINPRCVEERIDRHLHGRDNANMRPNFLWHMDSYDNLKPYGICINGAID